MKETFYFSEQKDGYLISCNPDLLNVNQIHAYLSQESYWAQAIPLQTVQKSIKNSLVFGILKNEDTIGFARVISDYSTFAYLADVYIIEKERKKGLSKWLLECILKHPQLKDLRRFMLATKDAHELYRKFGFEITKSPENIMEIKKENPYLT